MSREVIIPHSVRVTVVFDLDYPRNVAFGDGHSENDVLDMVVDDVDRYLEEAWSRSFIVTKLRCDLGEAPLPAFDISAVSI